MVHLARPSLIRSINSDRLSTRLSRVLSTAEGLAPSQGGASRSFACVRTSRPAPIVIPAEAGTQRVAYRSVRGSADDEAHRERQRSADSVPTEFRTPHASKGLVDLSGSFRKPRITAWPSSRLGASWLPLGSRLRGNDGSAHWLPRKTSRRTQQLLAACWI